MRIISFPLIAAAPAWDLGDVSATLPTSFLQRKRRVAPKSMSLEADAAILEKTEMDREKAEKNLIEMGRMKGEISQNEDSIFKKN